MMANDPFSSELYGELFAGAVAHRLFTDVAEIAAMLRFEAGLARAQASVGIIPAEPGARLAEALERITIEPAALAAGVGSSGMPVPALVVELRRRLPPELAQWVHFGATSQDAIDTGLMLRLNELFAALEGELATLRGRLAGLADAHRRTPIVARTRWQQAAPTSFGLKVATWLDPLNRLTVRLAEMRPRVLVVQCGGASGNLAQVGADGPRLIEALATELALSPALPWHSTRDRIVEAGDWLAALTGVLGKIGTDLVLMTQSEVGEITLAATGGSSTLPQKQNPVGPEMLVTLARVAANEIGALYQALPHAHERDGAAWTAEWFALPRLAAAADVALTGAGAIFAGLAPNTAKMLANIEASHGLILAEAASFALAEHMPRAEAQALVKKEARALVEQLGAAAAASDAGTGAIGAVAPDRIAPDRVATGGALHLIDRLAAATDAPVDWRRVRDPAAQFGAVDALIDQAITAAGARQPA